MNSGSNILIWILAVAVFASLGLSIAVLILQIRRDRVAKQSMAMKAKDKPQSVLPMPRQSGQAINIPKAQGEWQPPVWNKPSDYGDRTEALFSYDQSYNTTTTGSRTQGMHDAWQIYIKERGLSGERTYDVMVSGELLVGRSVQNGLKIDNSTVSGLQCVLIARQDCVYVGNRSNSNVTRLNGVKLEDIRPLKPGDILSLGSIQLSLLDICKFAVR